MRVLKVSAVALGLGLALLAAFFVWVRSAESRQWDRLDGLVRDLRAEARMMREERAALGWEREPGKAWDAYVEAARTPMTPLQRTEFVRYLDGDPAVDVSRVRSALEGFRAALGLLGAGTRRSDGSGPPADLASLEEGSLLRACYDLGIAAVAQAKSSMDAGTPAAAAVVALDACRFARDLGDAGGFTPAMTAYAVFTLSLDRLKSVVAAPETSIDVLRSIDADLAAVDASFPRIGRAMLDDGADLGERLSRGTFDEWVAKSGRSNDASAGWRFGFSSKLLRASAFDQAQSWLRRLKDVDSLSWAEELALWQAIEREVEDAAKTNALVRLLMSGWDRNAAGREIQARLRLLRTAAILRISGKDPSLKDPFGTLLRHEDAKERLKCWSVGKDGVDQSGDGAWREGRAKDVVLDFPR